MTSQFTLYPLNDLSYEIRFRKQNPDKPGSTLPLEDGAVTVFLATSEAPTATTADATLSVSATHINNGWWRVTFEGNTLTAALMATHFASTSPVMIWTHSSGVRVAVLGTYSASREAAAA